MEGADKTSIFDNKISSDKFGLGHDSDEQDVTRSGLNRNPSFFAHYLVACQFFISQFCWHVSRL
jgi:hypothetical protein